MSTEIALLKTKYFTLLVALFFSGLTYSQTLKSLEPSLVELLDKSPEGEIEYLKQLQKCEELFEKVNKAKSTAILSSEEITIFNNCNEQEQGYYDALADGCSWYCGAGGDSVTATSTLKTYKGINYLPANCHDLNYKTAWIEGVPGYGIGESVTYHFPPEYPRITEIKIANGYIKSEKSWKENSRVKKLKLYLNNKPIAVLNLEDNRNLQSFVIEPLGTANRDDWQKMKKLPWWTLTFEIMEVYKGDKYDETAITEIFFDGMDVHCLAAETPVTLWNNTTKAIESITPGDTVLSYNSLTNTFNPALVVNTIMVTHNNLVRITLEDRIITVTEDHPFLLYNHQWASVKPHQSNYLYKQDTPVTALITGAVLLDPLTNLPIRVLSINKVPVTTNMYTLELKGGNNFIAKGLITKTEVSIIH